MNKVSRTFRFPYELSKKLDSICVRSGDVTWHMEKALATYLDDYAPFTDKVPDKPVKTKATVKRFIKPELLELAEYFQEKGSLTCNDDAQAFTDHYTANGWKVGGKTPMKCWKASVRNWMRGKKNENNKSGSTKRPNKRDEANRQREADLNTIRGLAEQPHVESGGVLELYGDDIRGHLGFSENEGQNGQ